MNMATPKLSLFQAVRGRDGERLAQGVLRYLLTNDHAFRQSFCAWADFLGDCVRIDEEQWSGDLRHDLVLTFADGRRHAVELKLWADLTPNQRASPASMDLWILPARHRELGGDCVPRDRVRTWESLIEDVASTSEFARVLLDGFADFAWTGDSLTVEQLRADVRRWWVGDDDEGAWRTSWFLKGCAGRVEEFGLRSSASSQRIHERSCGYWGTYLKRSGADESWKEWLWLGFLFTVDAHGELTKHELVLGLMKNAAERLPQFGEARPDWYPDDGGGSMPKVIRIPSNDGMWTAEDFLDAVRQPLAAFVGCLPSLQTDHGGSVPGPTGRSSTSKLAQETQDP